MSDGDFKPGELVQLKSGGPRMTVKGLAFGTNELICSWWDGKKFQDREFEATQLKRCDPVEGPSVVGP